MARVTKVVELKKEVPKSWEDALRKYLLFKKAQGLREIAIEGHRDVIGLFFRRYPASYMSDELDVALFSFMGEEIKPATYNIRRNYLTQFFDGRSRRGSIGKTWLRF